MAYGSALPTGSTFSVVASTQKLSVIFLKRNQTFLASNNDDPASPDVVSGLTFDSVGIYLTIDVSSSALLWRKHYR